MKLKGFLSTFAVLVAAAAMAKVEIKTNIESGATVSGDVKILALVTSNNLVTNVEFSVNNDIRLADDSSPYEMNLDTIAETEGPITIKIEAFTSEGERAQKVLNLKIDNQLSKGADFFVEQGNEHMTEGAFVKAVLSGRLALKAKPKYVPARLLMARANFQLGVLDLAQKFAEEVLAEDANNLDALDLSAAIGLRQAFQTMDRGDRRATLATIGTALKTAAERRARVYDARLEAVGTPTDANLVRWADLGMAAGSYGAVINELEKRFVMDPTKTSISNRLVYAQLRNGRVTDAFKTMGIYQRRGRPDAIGNALYSVMLQMAGNTAESITAERSAVAADASDLTVRSAQAVVSLMRGNLPVYSQLVNDLAKDQGGRMEVQFMQSLLANSTGDFQTAEAKFQSAALLEPTSQDVYILRANQLFGYSLNAATSKEVVEFQRSLAKSFLEAALNARPESFDALTGLAILEMANSKFEEGSRFADAAVKAGPQYAAAHYVNSLAQTFESQRLRRVVDALRQQANTARNNRSMEEAARLDKQANDTDRRANDLQVAGQRSLVTAAQLDPSGLGGKGLPSVLEAWTYFASRGRTLLLIPPQY